MERTAVVSSNIKSRGYDPETKMMEVEFRGGAVYRYLDVPPDVWQEWLQAGSAGSHFAANIRPNYDGTRVGS